MKKITTILIGFAFMAFLCFQATALPFFGDHSLKNSIIKASADYTGIVDILTDTNSPRGFYVEANLAYYPYNSEEKSNRTSSSSITPEAITKMMISTVNNETLLVSKCLNFRYYNCTQFHCHLNSGQREISYPTFTASAQSAQSYIYLDKKYWTLTSTPFYLAQDCQTGNLASSIGLNRSGVLGLATNGEASNDYKLTQKFAIYINPNLTSGQLLFTGDISYAKSSNPMFTLKANSTWRVHIFSGSIVTSSGAAGFNGIDLMFDINSDAIGLPYDIYTLFISYFTKTPGLSCSSDLYRPYCSIQNYDLLADITIQFDGNIIKIPPKIYATPIPGSSYFYLNLKATGPTLSGNNYVSPGFQQTIILDANFMSYYFTVFDATTGTNKIYLYEAGSLDNLGSNMPWVAVGAVVVIFLAIIGCCCAKKKTVNKETVVTDTTQQPLVYNYPAYYAQPQPQAVYNTNGYQQQQPQGFYPAYNNNGYQQPQGVVYHN